MVVYNLIMTNAARRFLIFEQAACTQLTYTDDMQGWTITYS